jgi:hypothetical protein
MARAAIQQGLLPRKHVCITPDSRCDNDCSDEWAQKLSKYERCRTSMIRQQAENLRPMPCQIVPETWTRQRPSSRLLLATSPAEATTFKGDVEPLVAPPSNAKMIHKDRNQLAPQVGACNLLGTNSKPDKASATNLSALNLVCSQMQSA